MRMDGFCAILFGKTKNNNITFDVACPKIGLEYPPFVIAEIGINYKGVIEKA